MGYVVDVSGHLFRTEDGGKSWRAVQSRTKDLQGAAFFSQREGLLVGDFGLLRTSDGGRTWQSVRVTPRLRFDAVAVLDARHWWLQGDTCVRFSGSPAKLPPCDNAHLLRTADGGRSWIAIRFSPRRLVGGSLTFVTPRVGYVGVAPYGVYRTTDGGRTWRFVDSRSSLSEP